MPLPQNTSTICRKWTRRQRSSMTASPDQQRFVNTGSSLGLHNRGTPGFTGGRDTWIKPSHNNLGICSFILTLFLSQIDFKR